MDGALRLIDANANRAREATRLLEDVARFIFDDQDLAALAKSIRHDLTDAVSRVGILILHRDTPGDVGTTLTTEGETSRAGLHDVAAAAGRRLGEALRAIEEVAKTINPDAAAAIEQVRYRGYELERRVLDRLARPAPTQWRVCVLLTDAICGSRGWSATLDAMLDAPPDCVQLREKDLTDRDLLVRARDVVRRCHARQVAVVINDRPDICVLSGADGVHLGQGDMAVRDARAIVGAECSIGVSTSNVEQAMQAREDGADVCGIGPMFPTTTKTKPVLAGPEALRAYVQWAGLPHLAIGGIGPENVSALAASGCRGVAVSSSVCGASDPAAAVLSLRSVLEAS